MDYDGKIHHTETRRCISIPCGAEFTVDATTEDGTAPHPNAIDEALYALGWREGFCPKHTGLGPT